MIRCYAIGLLQLPSHHLLRLHWAESTGCGGGAMVVDKYLRAAGMPEGC